MRYFDYKENNDRGSFDFPMEYYYVTSLHPRYHMVQHFHTEIEIIRVLEGDFLFQINSENFTAKKGDVFFIPDNALHSGVPNDCIYECIVFDINLLLKNNNACSKQICNIMSYKTIDTKLPRNIERLNENIASLFESMKLKKAGYEIIAQASLYYILGLILEHELFKDKKAVIKKTEKSMEQFKIALTLIESNYMNKITLNDLAKNVGMNPGYFCKFFHEMSNKRPMEYINQYRIEIACEQIIGTDHSILDIALNSGFNDISYFIKIFKRYKGVSPKQYQKLQVTGTGFCK